MKTNQADAQQAHISQDTSISGGSGISLGSQLTISETKECQSGVKKSCSGVGKLCSRTIGFDCTQ